VTIDFEFLDSFERKRVLIVDDDGFILGVLEKLLNMLGIESVVRANHGGEALAVLEEQAVDLVISDVQMPSLDGLSMLKQIRMGRSGAPAHLPCIIVTSLEEEAVLVAAMRLDANGFVQKPFKTPMLIKRLLIALSESIVEMPGHPYSEVVIDLEQVALEGEGAGPSLGQSHQSQHIPLERDEKFTLVSLFQLRSDMQLAEDIKTKNGTVLLSAGFTLNEARVHRMWELEENLEKTSFRVIGGWT
jgi:CheY-like chemotaxis protein